MDLRLIRGGIPIEISRAAENLASSSRTTFLSYLQQYYGEVVERVFATRKKKQQIQLTEILRFATGKAHPIAKNLLYNTYGGYSAVYSCKKVYGHAGGYPYLVFDEDDFDKWEKITVIPGLYKTYINAVDFLKNSDEFKYCGFTGGDAIHWLNEYRKDSSIEILGKLGLSLSPKLRSHIRKDGKFRRFVFEHNNEVALYGVEATEYAFKHGVPIEKARAICYVKRYNGYLAASFIPSLTGTKVDKSRVIDYCDDNDISYSSYNDFLTAVKALRLDLTDTKNLFPRNFAEMHDIYTKQYKAEQDELIARDFSEAVEKAQKYRFAEGTYLITIPSNIEDLVVEGSSLSHCVGRMGYGKKMAEGKSVILFVREKEHPDTPFVTVELNPLSTSIIQKHGKNNSAPSQEVNIFLDHWIEKIKKGKR